MTKDQIDARVNAIVSSIVRSKGEGPDDASIAAMIDLAKMVLFDLHRIADGIERMSQAPIHAEPAGRG
jgi:hypothetical protein